MKIQIENLKHQMMGVKLNTYQRSLALNEYYKLLDYVNELDLLTIPDVSQQRELLKKWWKYFDEESVAVNCNDEEREEVINNFFNHI